MLRKNGEEKAGEKRGAGLLAYDFQHRGQLPSPVSGLQGGDAENTAG